MTTTAVATTIPAAWMTILNLHPLSVWNEVDDSDLPIPKDFIAVRAYYLHVSSGRNHGRDKADWLRAEADLRKAFRKYAEVLSELNWGDFDDYLSEKAITTLFEPIMVSDSSLSGSFPSQPECEQIATVDCNTGSPHGKMGDMSRNIKMRKISYSDPRLAGTLDEFTGYRDSVGDLTDSDRRKYLGKVLAVLCDTGEIVAAASDVNALRAAVAEAGYASRIWRLVDGPTSASKVPLSEIETLYDE